MPLLLKILNEVKGRKALKVDGYSGVRYKFDWNPDHKAYVYIPKNQGETDDLYKTVGRVTAYVFAPIVIGETPAPLPPPQPAPKQDEALRQQCAQRGIVLTATDTDDTALRLSRAYDKGVSDTLETVPSKRPKPANKKPPEESSG
jgi:hypothetical protein